MIKGLASINYPWLLDSWNPLVQRYLTRNAKASIPHALLITGADGVGKLALAARIVHSVLCRQPDEAGIACGECKSCKMLNGGGHPDMVILEHPEDSQQIKVDQVRELIHTLHLSAGMSGYRVALIKDAERMNNNAANALLKTLEEPGDKTILLLCTSHPGRLPATIRSRCQQVHVPLPNESAAADYLKTLPDHSDDDIQLALRLAGGAPLLAGQILESDQLQTVRDIYTQLDGLASGQQSISAMTSDWQEHEPRDCWQWILFWLHQGISGQTTWPLLGKINTHQQQDLYQAALKGWQRASSGLRHDLQFQEWLLQWQSVASQAGRI